MPSKSRKTCVIRTSLTPEEAEDVFMSQFLGRRSFWTKQTDGRNKWQTTTINTELVSDSGRVVGVEMTPGLLAMLGAPRPKAMVGAKIAMATREDPDGPGTEMSVWLAGGTTRMGIIEGGSAFARYYKRIFRAVSERDPNAKMTYV